MYDGQEASGWELLRMAQAAREAIDASLLRELRAKRDSSPYWQALARDRTADQGKP